MLCASEECLEPAEPGLRVCAGHRATSPDGLCVVAGCSRPCERHRSTCVAHLQRKKRRANMAAAVRRRVVRRWDAAIQRLEDVAIRYSDADAIRRLERAANSYAEADAETEKDYASKHAALRAAAVQYAEHLRLRTLRARCARCARRFRK